MAAPARVNEPPSETLPLEERSRRRAFELYLEEAASAARNSIPAPLAGELETIQIGKPCACSILPMEHDGWCGPTHTQKR
jgi:hypothetical protein